MTQPTPMDDELRQTAVVEFGGRTMVVSQLTDTQTMHMMRYARILQKAGEIDRDALMEAAERCLAIIHSCVKDKEDRAFLIQLEEEGELGLRDLIKVAQAFRPEEKAETKPTVQRGRPRRVAK